MVRGAREIRCTAGDVLPTLVLVLGGLAAGAGYLASRPPGLPERYCEAELTVTGMT